MARLKPGPFKADTCKPLVSDVWDEVFLVSTRKFLAWMLL